MKQARYLGLRMHLASKQQQLIVLDELAEAQVLKKQEEQHKEEKRKQKHRLQVDRIMVEVMDQGGVVSSADEILQVLKNQNTKGLKMRAIKAQVDYQKVIRKLSSPLLKTAKIPLAQLAINLATFLFGDDAAQRIQGQEIAEACVTRRPTKQRQLIGQDSSEVTDTESTDSDSENESEAEHEAFEQMCEDNFHFTYTHQEQTVAVFYSDEDENFTFYLGKVVSVENESLANVSFLSRKGNDNIFKWPEVEDLDTVSCKHVFYADFELLSKNRAYQVNPEHWEDLNVRWEEYLRLFC